jgi:hypothetical protein
LSQLSERWENVLRFLPGEFQVASVRTHVNLIIPGNLTGWPDMDLLKLLAGLVELNLTTSGCRTDDEEG